ncbi:hypothetical protein M6B38_245675 [Iris pallida]|uniref:Uncharacterized protein n=1 Tax=Iris pallida TaxID=29817 RepID=A0AAX6DHA7_IRIPA|nr:hypothetical protein M6B38_245675 [Iris pallida]
MTRSQKLYYGTENGCICVLGVGLGDTRNGLEMGYGIVSCQTRMEGVNVIV